MPRKNKKQVEGRSRITRGRRLHDLEDSETEEELRRFLKEGDDAFYGDREEEEGEEEPNTRRYRVVHDEPLGTMGQIWNADNS
jgi:hypothetical protein